MSEAEQAEADAQKLAEDTKSMKSSAEASAAGGAANDESLGPLDAPIQAYVDSAMGHVETWGKTPLDAPAIQAKQREKEAALKQLEQATKSYIKSLDKN